MADERHLLLASSFAPKADGVWAMTRRGRRAKWFGYEAYRRPLPLNRQLSRGKNPFAITTALEPKVYPVVVRCPRCELKQRVEADQIEVISLAPTTTRSPS